MPNYMTELSPDNNTNVYQVKDKEAAPIDLLKDTVGWSGKNLLAYPYKSGTKTENGVTFTDNKDGSVTISIAQGGATADSTFYFHDQTTGIRNSLLEANKLILSGGISNNIYINVWNAKGDSASVASTGDEALVDFTNQNNDFNIILRVKSGTTLANAITIKPMLRKADILDSTYEPYHESVEEVIGDIRAEQRVLGAKNLLEVTLASTTKNGITATVNNDGSVTLSGTSTAWTDFNLHADSVFPQGEYIVSTPNVANAAFRIWDVTHDVSLYNSLTDGISKRISVGSNTTLRYLISINKELAVNGIIKPMLRLATDPDDTYVPYAMTNRELTENVIDGWTTPVEIDISDTVLDGYGTLKVIQNVTKHLAGIIWAGTGTAPTSALILNNFSVDSFLREKAIAQWGVVMRRGDYMLINADNTINLQTGTQSWSSAYLIFPTKPK